MKNECVEKRKEKDAHESVCERIKNKQRNRTWSLTGLIKV
jgi:hypothetical protein